MPPRAQWRVPMAIITGTALRDILFGTAFADTIDGKDGNDDLYGFAGNDTMWGGNGNARMWGGSGNDVVSGEAGDDLLFGELGNDILSGGLGNDQLDGGMGADNMMGGAGNDAYWVDNVGDVVTELVNQGIDTVNSTISYMLGANVENLNLLDAGGAISGTGNALANIIQGNAFDNTLAGLAGNDVLRGGLGNDVLDGGDGQDRLYGGFGADTMTGGLGADTFVIEGANQTAAVVPFMIIYDRITDFSAAQGDHIDVSAIDANLLMAGDQPFTYIGANAFTGVPGQRRCAGGIVMGDLNGDTVGDFRFDVNIPVLAATDFVL